MEPPNSLYLSTSSPIHIGFMPGAETLNRRILQGYRQLGQQGLLRRSHFFGGRYENLYVDRARLPEIDWVLKCAEGYARRILQLREERLRCGFWLNDMGPGHTTTEHTHEEDDELLSGVYYVRVPEGSGELLIRDRDMRSTVQPQEGMFVFFPPQLPHAVSENRSVEARLSIAMNFGPLQR
jgi:hypothetical protein